MAQETYTRFYNLIKQIPKGKVATYGQIAGLAGLSGRARQVGYALNVNQEPDLPWHRVVNAKGQVSKRADPVFEDVQRHLLERENIFFDENGCIPLEIFQWKP